ncbi:MAG: hypothetical protein ACTS81_00390 [Arsenophonus sp. ER-BJ3-MAG3]
MSVTSQICCAESHFFPQHRLILQNSKYEMACFMKKLMFHIYNLPLTNLSSEMFYIYFCYCKHIKLITCKL